MFAEWKSTSASVEKIYHHYLLVCSSLSRQVDGFDIIEGDFQGLPDTAQFLCDLSQLYGDVVTRASHLAGTLDSQEYSAAKDLFLVEVLFPSCLKIGEGFSYYSQARQRNLYHCSEPENLISTSIFQHNRTQ